MRWRGFLKAGSSSRLLALLFLALGPALAQGLPQVRELSERELYWFLANRTQEVVAVGLPPASLGEALKEKRLTLVLGREAPPPWARGAKVVRLGGTPMAGWFLLADGRFFVAPKGGKYVVVESREVAATLYGYFAVVLSSP
ncbi:hypothetical protein Ththe16_2391 (plasmid) [Thermus thermophilus SG0.5JP17-16]|uniref:Uncharacterized protein n=1 Tax=Thermus thermophilus (strain SG0.5JP17-16) TaxID=762633 RepID=F6DIS8_THETG|nr:hypothetical protein [Thermus thermophilus]AEG34744.1 hypothetical protein Ththe16_2391 [Thermus thermophilus SG0.5JP17-16]